MQDLLDVLRGDKRQEPAHDWLAVLQVAGEENLLSWVSARVLSTQENLPADVRQSLLAINQEAQRTAFLWTSTLKHTLAAFHQRGIPVISLKGPWLAERLYGDAALRSSSDLDLLVQPIHVPVAEDVLCELGFVPCGHWDDRHRRWRRTNIDIELHHNVENPLIFDFGIEQAWERALCSQFHGAPGWLLAPADELRFLCLHAIRHAFECLSLLLDLTLAFRLLPLPDASAFAGRNSELRNVMVLNWMMARRLEIPLPLPSVPLEWLTDRIRLEKLADRLWQQRVAKPGPALVTGSTRGFHFLALFNFFVETEAPGWRRALRRLRYSRVLLTRPIEADFAFAARLKLHRSWQAIMLRPIRLLLKTARILSPDE
jgi:hypothetical protein